MAPLFAAAGGALQGAGGALSAVLGLAGTVISAAGAAQAADAQAKAYEHQAAQMEIKGKQEQAAAYWDAQQEKRKKNFLISRLQSKAAASGFEATSPDVIKLGEGVTKLGTMNQMMATAGGRIKSAGLMDSAAAARYDAQAARSAGSLNAFSTILGGVGGMFQSLPSGSNALRYS